MKLSLAPVTMAGSHRSGRALCGSSPAGGSAADGRALAVRRQGDCRQRDARLPVHRRFGELPGQQLLRVDLRHDQIGLVRRGQLLDPASSRCGSLLILPLAMVARWAAAPHHQPAGPDDHRGRGADDAAPAARAGAQHGGSTRRSSCRSGAGSGPRRSAPCCAASTTAFVFGIALLMVLGEFGFDLAPLLASAGIAGVALGFGAQSLVKDLIAGLFMLIEDQYGVGDNVDLGEAIGVVEAVGLRVTTVRDGRGVLWYIRNGEIIRVGNKSQGWALVVVDLPIGFASTEEATAVLRTAAAVDRGGPGAVAGDRRAAGGAGRRADHGGRRGHPDGGEDHRGRAVRGRPGAAPAARPRRWRTRGSPRRSRLLGSIPVCRPGRCPTARPVRVAPPDPRRTSSRPMQGRAAARPLGYRPFVQSGKRRSIRSP